MSKLNYSIFINAPKEKVWDIMLQDATYREWTKPFNPTSYYKGSWEQGSRMLFVGTDDKGVAGGMVAEIAENRLHEFVSIRHLGEIQNGVEKLYEGVNTYENYTFNEKDGGTELIIDLIGLPEEYKGMFEEMWPNALQKLKELAEK